MRTLCLALLVSALCWGQPKPDFNGVWEMNIAKSNFDKQPPSKPMSITIEYKAPKMKQSILHQGDDAPGIANYVLDGAEGANEVRGNPLKYKARWDGATLVIETWGTFGPNTIRLVDKYLAAEDGKSFTILRHFEGPGGPQDQKLIFEKKETK